MRFSKGTKNKAKGQIMSEIWSNEKRVKLWCLGAGQLKFQQANFGLDFTNANDFQNQIYFLI